MPLETEEILALDGLCEGCDFDAWVDADRKEKYQDWLYEKMQKDPDFLKPLEGKNLACWCPLTRTCHADILLAMVAPIKVTPYR